MRKFRGVFAHLSIIFAGMFITLTILNQYNPAMGFLSGRLASVFILFFCLWVVALSVATIVDNRHHNSYMRQRAEEAARWKRVGANMQRPPQREGTPPQERP